jgi:hypothetical protein
MHQSLRITILLRVTIVAERAELYRVMSPVIKEGRKELLKQALVRHQPLPDRPAGRRSSAQHDQQLHNRQRCRTQET